MAARTKSKVTPKFKTTCRLKNWPAYEAALKRIVGDGLGARRFEAQQREAMIGLLVINRMTELGMPQSVAIAS